ncbi:hypothetical protein PILCRDRAFT_816690, partial [Piloderma croceum F 1598]
MHDPGNCQQRQRAHSCSLLHATPSSGPQQHYLCCQRIFAIRICIILRQPRANPPPHQRIEHDHGPSRLELEKKRRVNSEEQYSYCSVSYEQQSVIGQLHLAL